MAVEYIFWWRIARI